MSNTLKAYQVGTIDGPRAVKTLTTLGMQTQTATVLLTTTDTAEQTTLASGVLSRIKAALLKGSITRDQAHTLVKTAGIVEPRATQYVTSWEMDLNMSAKALTASEILKYFSEGLLGLKDAQARLKTLGYSQPDAQLKVQDEAMKMLKRRVSAEQAILKGNKTGLATLASLASDAAAQAQTLFKQAEHDQPVMALKKWYEGGAITAEYAVEVLVDYGYTPTAAERTVTTWTVGGLATAAQEASGKQPNVRIGTPKSG
jgi:Holliday junction resolvasome RuvABC DNA-binding subunit